MSQTIDYSKTLNLPQTDFPMRAGLPEAEPKIIARWHEMDLYKRLREDAAGRYRVLGPAHAPLARLRQEHRFQVVLKGSRPAMRGAVRRALVRRYGETRWPGVAVDVDPVSVM